MTPLLDLVVTVSAWTHGRPWPSRAPSASRWRWPPPRSRGRLSRRSSASVRHLVWASALAGSLAMPRAPARLAVVASPDPPARQGRPIRLRSTPGPRPSRTSRTGAAHDRRDRRDDRTNGGAAEDLKSSPSVEPTQPRGSLAVPWAFWLTAAWGVGVAVVLVPLLIARARLRRIVRRPEGRTMGTWPTRCPVLGDRSLTSRRVVMLRGDETASPMTWGVLRPVILLPAGVESWPRERLRARAPARAGACEAMGLPDPGACPACLRGLLVPSARLDRRVAAPDRERTRLRRPGAAIRRTRLGLRLRPAGGGAGFRPARGHAAAAMPMARPSQLEGRLRAILDPSRSRRVGDTPRGIPVARGGRGSCSCRCRSPGSRQAIRRDPRRPVRGRRRPDRPG